MHIAEQPLPGPIKAQVAKRPLHERLSRYLGHHFKKTTRIRTKFFEWTPLVHTRSKNLGENDGN